MRAAKMLRRELAHFRTAYSGAPRIAAIIYRSIFTLLTITQRSSFRPSVALIIAVNAWHFGIIAHYGGDIARRNNWR